MTEGKTIEITGGSAKEREQLREWVAKALDDLGVFVTMVTSTGGYEYNHRRFKARPADGFVMGDVAILPDA